MWYLHHGDSREIMRTLDRVDSIVTDPPYGLTFMGKSWDNFEVPGGSYLTPSGKEPFKRLPGGLQVPIAWVPLMPLSTISLGPSAMELSLPKQPQPLESSSTVLIKDK